MKSSHLLFYIPNNTKSQEKKQTTQQKLTSQHTNQLFSSSPLHRFLCRDAKENICWHSSNKHTVKITGCNASSWQHWWVVDWYTGFVLQFSICFAPADLLINRYNAALILLCPSLPISCHSFPALLSMQLCYLHNVCASLTVWKELGASVRDTLLWQHCTLLPYPSCFQQSERSAEQVSGLGEESRSQ